MFVSHGKFGPVLQWISLNYNETLGVFFYAGLGVDSVTVPVLPLDVNRDMLLKLDAMLQLVLDYLNIVRNGSDRLCDEVWGR